MVAVLLTSCLIFYFRKCFLSVFDYIFCVTFCEMQSVIFLLRNSLFFPLSTFLLRFDFN